MEFETVLKKSFLFKHVEAPGSLFSPGDWEFRSFPKGGTVATTFDDCLNLGIVVEGTLEIQTLYPSGKIASLKKLGPLDLFGEAILPGRIHTHPSDLVALVPSRVLLIRKTALLEALKRHDALLENYIGLLSEKLLMMNGRLKMLSLETLRKKICWLLLETHARQKTPVLSLAYTQEELANLLGSQRPSVSRELNRMRREGLIDFSRNRIEIKDPGRLRELLG